MAKESEQEKETNLRENTGKLLLDLGKLVVGGVIIGGIVRGAIPQIILIASGTVVAIVFFVFGLMMTTKENKKSKE